MDLLILGGTGWLGRELAWLAVQQGDTVSCLARGDSGPVADGAALVAVDRLQAGAYDAVQGRPWSAVVEVSWQPGFVRGALAALAGSAAHWTYISSLNVYASHARVGADESAPTLTPTELDVVEMDLYGQAKVACEQASRALVGDKLLIARAGLIGGPGDASGRSGSWVARCARDQDGPMLVPDTPDLATAVIDVRDLTQWLLARARDRTTGVYDTVGPVVAFNDWLELSRQVGGHRGPLVAAAADWLLQQGVNEWMGPESMAMWLVEKGTEGWSTRSGAAALATGLRHRPRTDLLTDLLGWEREQGLDRPRLAGLSAPRESDLLATLAKNAT